MEFRNIFIERPAKLSVWKNQLAIEQAERVTLPLEDISNVLLESREITITAYALSEMCRHGINLFVCDEKHLPNGTLLPFNCYCRQLKQLQKQISLPKPLEKQLWKAIVVQKIKNQAECLKLLGIDGWKEIFDISKSVTSGDEGNAEAVAAKKYFPLLFGQGFKRSSGDIANAALNYAYAILRGVIARNLAVYGFEPCVGLHHCSQLNNFNLADDLIEPFRPFADLLVAGCAFSGNNLEPYMKHNLFNITNYLAEQKGKKFRMSAAVENCVISLSQSLDAGKNMLDLPKLIPLEEYRYE